MASQRHNSYLKQFLNSHKPNQSNSPTGSAAKSRVCPVPTEAGRPPVLTIERGKTFIISRAKDQVSNQKDQSRHANRGASYRAVNQSKLAKITWKPTAEGLPEELWRYIFSLLNPNDLLLCARVCRRWLNLTNDNLIWQNVYKRYVLNSKRGQKSGTTSAEKIGPQPVNPPAAYWKAQCIQRSSEMRNKAAMVGLKKIHPFTGLPANTESALQKSGVRWCLGLVDSDNQEHVIDYRDAFYFRMATCVRWYGLDLPSINRIRKLRLFSANPVFFDRNGKPHPNSPCQRSLLIELDFQWSSLSSTIPFVAVADSIKIYILSNNLVIAIWKDGGEIAFITANFHYHSLLQRCLMGKSSRPYQEPQHVPTQDDVDSKRGLHGYNITVELRNQQKSFFSQQFRDLYCHQGNISAGYATFQLIQEDRSSEHSPVGKKIGFPWKTDLFKGIAQNICILDLTLLDESGTPMWCMSAPVKVASPNVADVVYDYDGDHYFIDYMDTKGKVTGKLVWEEEIGQYMIMYLNVQLTTKFIGEWFATTI